MTTSDFSPKSKSFTFKALCAAALTLGIATAEAATSGSSLELIVGTPDSLSRNGPSPVIRSEEGDRAAKSMFEGITTNDLRIVGEAVEVFAQLSADNPHSPNYYGLRWIGDCWIADQTGKPHKFETPFFDQIYRRFAADNYALLREYLQRNFGTGGFKPDDMTRHVSRLGFLDDILMFNNPLRDEWGKTRVLLDALDIRTGQTVLDIGSGFGFFTWHFSQMVGDTGRVFAIDTSKEYLETTQSILADAGCSNVTTVVSEIDDIKVREKADVAYICSLYHVIYGWQKETERRALLQSILASLKPDGRLLIVENYNLRGRELNSCFISPELVRLQLYFYGFELEKTVPISELQFLMVFRRSHGNSFVVHAGSEKPESPIVVNSGKSLIHIGSLDSYDVTEVGITCARLALDAITSGDRNAGRKAVEAYDEIIPRENFGGEYTAIRWFCQWIATEEEADRRQMLADPLVSAYFDFLSQNNFAHLKEYLTYKYRLDEKNENSAGSPPTSGPAPGGGPPPPALRTADSATTPSASNTRVEKSEGPPIANLEKENPQDVREIGQTRRAFLEDFILFNNPYRPEWEQSDRILAALPYKAGDQIADIGCGGGFYTYRFSRIVGPKGHVYALDIKKEHLDFVSSFSRNLEIQNITTIQSEMDDPKLAEPVDHAYMCSLYHIIYGVNSFQERDTYIRKLKQKIRKGGTFCIVDNGPVDDNLLLYHGPHIARELIVAQLAHYGFSLVKYEQIIPQRYVLVFRND